MPRAYQYQRNVEVYTFGKLGLITCLLLPQHQENQAAFSNILTSSVIFYDILLTGTDFFASWKFNLY